MTALIPSRTPLVARAHRLVMFSMVAPYVLYLPVIPALAAREEPNPYSSSTNLFITIGFAIVFGSVGVSIFRGIIKIPTGWQSGGCFYGSLIAFYFLPMAFQLKDDLRIERADAAYAVAVVALNIGIVLVGWLPARHAARLVLGNLLSSDVVDSSLIIKFTAQGEDTMYLRVTPDALEFEFKPRTKDEFKRSYPLTDVTAVAVRAEARDIAYLAPGAANGSHIRVTRGDVLVIDLPEGQLVFPEKKDVHRAKQFIEARVRRAAVVDG